MALAKTISSYEDARELLQQAIESERGIGVESPTFEAATALRFRLYHARRVEQKENKKRYPAGHAMHGRSYFDTLMLTIEQVEDGWLVKVQKTPEIKFNVRSL